MRCLGDKKSLFPALAKKRGISNNPSQLATQKPIIVVDNSCRSACQRQYWAPKQPDSGKHSHFAPM